MIGVLFCPRCGEPASLNESQEMTCLSTGATLGRGPSLELLKWAKSEPWDDGFRLKIDTGVQWHCPSCSNSCQESNGKIWCPNCHRFLTPFAFYLTELYPHP